jgi:MFS transporter, DHA2 family, multidrug resistance protein
MAANTATAGVAPVQSTGWPPPLVLLSFIGMLFGMFMAVLDIQIVAASIGQLQGGLAAEPDEVSWIQTSYLIAEVVMLPLSGLLQRALSTRVVFVLSALGFTIASALCAFATTIDEMIIYRAIQGFVGGAMIPTAFSQVFTLFGRDKQISVMVMTMLIVTLAPTIGPTLGGWITANYSWHWLFLINLVPGVLVAAVVWTCGRKEPQNIDLLKNVDITSLISVAVFLAALQYFLEEGAKNQWFEDDHITLTLLISGAAFIIFLYRSFTAKVPAVNLQPFADTNFWRGCFLMLLVGFTLYGVVYLYPLYLSRVGMLNSQQIGNIMWVSGAAMLVTAPIAGILGKRFDMRYIAATGILTIALSAWLTAQMTWEWRFDEFLVPQILRGIGLMLCMSTLSTLSFSTLSPHLIADASGLYSLVRNAGGAISLALINTISTERYYYHWNKIASQLNPGRAEVQAMFDGFGAYLSDRLPSEAQILAIKQINGLLVREATVMTYSDCFFLLAVAMLACTFIPFTIQKASHATPIDAH